VSKFATLAPQNSVEARKTPSQLGLLRGQTTPGISGNSLKKSFKEVLEGQLMRQSELPQTKKSVRNESSSPEKRLNSSSNRSPDSRTGLSRETFLDKKNAEFELNTIPTQGAFEGATGNRVVPTENVQNRRGLRSTSLSPSRIEGKVNEQDSPTNFLGREQQSKDLNRINADSNKDKVKLIIVDRRQASQRPATDSVPHQNGFGAAQDNIPNHEPLNNRQFSTTTQEVGNVLARVETPMTRQGLSQAAMQTRVVQVPPAFYQQLHSEFLDRAKLILKNGGGEMRLTLRPENLGSLRLSVSLEERVLKGQIVVDNETVRTLVESQLDSLLRSFREDGFTPLELKVSVAGEEGRGNTGHGSDQESTPDNRSSEQESFQDFFGKQNHLELEA